MLPPALTSLTAVTIESERPSGAETTAFMEKRSTAKIWRFWAARSIQGSKAGKQIKDSSQRQTDIRGLILSFYQRMIRTVTIVHGYEDYGLLNMGLLCTFVTLSRLTAFELTRIGLPWDELTRLTWIDWNWLELNQTDLNWLGLTWIDSDWLELTWVELNWLRLTWIGSDWLGLTWTDLNRLGLNWIGLNGFRFAWIGSGWLALTRMKLDWIELTENALDGSAQ